MTDEQIITHFRDKWNMTIESDGNGGYFVNSFTLRQETETRQSFGRDIETTVWVIEVSEIVHGGFHEPDSYEIVELARERNLGLTLAKVAQIEFNETIQRGLEELHEQMEEQEFAEFCKRAEKELAKTECPCAGGDCA